MKIIPTDNFAHISGRVFCKGLVYEVTEASAAEFVKGGIATIVEVTKKSKASKAELPQAE